MHSHGHSGTWKNWVSVRSGYSCGVIVPISIIVPIAVVVVVVVA